MEQLLDFIPDIITLLACGIVAGFLAGLLGIGGGLVLIPSLFVVLDGWGVGLEQRMHICIATSLVVIVFTNISSVRAHHKKAAVDWQLIRAWWLAIVLGSLLGSFAAQELDGDMLLYFFIGLIFVLALKMLLPLDSWTLGENLPTGVSGQLFPFLAGYFSAILGIGGGSFNVPYMTLYGRAVHQAVATASVCGLVIAITGGAGFLIGKPDGEGLRYMMGYVHLPSVFALAVTAVLFAPAGAWAAHRLSKRGLSIIFGVFLVISGGRMLASVL